MELPENNRLQQVIPYDREYNVRGDDKWNEGKLENSETNYQNNQKQIAQLITRPAHGLELKSDHSDVGDKEETRANCNEK